MCRVKDKEEMRRGWGTKRERGREEGVKREKREEEAEREGAMPPLGWGGHCHAHIICFSASLSYFLHFTERRVRHREVKGYVQYHKAKTLSQDLNSGLADFLFATLGEPRQG